MKTQKISERFGSAKAPRRIRGKTGEEAAETMKRWRTKWAEYHDAQIMAECAYQASFKSTPRRKVHFFRAFYGVEGHYLVAAGV